MKKRYDIDKFYKNVADSFKEIEQSAEFPSHFYKAFYGGERTVYQKEQTESRKFDIVWIKTIESYFPSINRITVNVKSTLKYQSEIIPIEKTKKISRESVVHLMAHSNLIREIDEEGNVVPKQILSNLSEIEYGIYENRFIMTLIIRLRDFIGKRVKLMREKLKGTKVTHLNMNSKFNFDDTDFEMLIDIKQTELVNSRRTDEYNKMVLERAELLYKLVNRLQRGQFMSIMKRYKPVTSPIMKTQVILKNPDFKNAYLLWLYLDKCNDLGYDLDISTINKRFTPQYEKHLNQAMLLNVSTMISHDKAKNPDTSTNGKSKFRVKKAKNLTYLPMEIDTTPIAYEVDDLGVNEYYLNKNRQILKKQFDECLNEEDGNYKVALKKALVDTLNITNSIYESFFEINADDDIFQRLIKEDDPVIMLEEAYEKHRIAKTVREVKEKDYLKAIKLEQKWQKQLALYQKNLLNQQKNTLDKRVDDLLKTSKGKYDKQKDDRNTKRLQEKAKLMQKNKKELIEFEKKLKADLRTEKAKLNAESKERLIKEREKIKKQAQQQRLKDAEKRKKEKERLRVQQRKKKEQLKQQMLKKREQQKASIKKSTEDKIVALNKSSIKKVAKNTNIKVAQNIALNNETIEQKREE